MPAASSIKFNKMFVMLPVMFLARKLDGEDPKVVHWLRVAYAAAQLMCVCVALYTYWRATTQVTDGTIVYVPPPAMVRERTMGSVRKLRSNLYGPHMCIQYSLFSNECLVLYHFLMFVFILILQPFGGMLDAADGGATKSKKYTEVVYSAHVAAQAKSLVTSTLFGIAMTVGLHYYKGMIVGLAIQTVMAPVGLVEHVLVYALLMKGGWRVQDRMFDEKLASELNDADEIVNANGTVIKTGKTNKTITAKETVSSSSLEDILLDTWDGGNTADLSQLLAAMNDKTVNYQTKENAWTPLMIASGLGAPGCVNAIRTLLELGANVRITDKEGWTALHWAAFHGQADAAAELADVKLLGIKDKEGYTPLEMARKEKNDKVAKVYEDALAETKKDK
jgi:hypothetical protein